MVFQEITSDIAFWVNDARISSLAPNEDGTISGDVTTNGGWVYPGAWASPIINPEKNIEPMIKHVSIMEFAELVGEDLGIPGQRVVDAIARGFEKMNGLK